MEDSLELASAENYAEMQYRKYHTADHIKETLPEHAQRLTQCGDVLSTDGLRIRPTYYCRQPRLCHQCAIVEANLRTKQVKQVLNKFIADHGSVWILRTIHRRDQPPFESNKEILLDSDKRFAKAFNQLRKARSKPNSPILGIIGRTHPTSKQLWDPHWHLTTIGNGNFKQEKLQKTVETICKNAGLITHIPQNRVRGLPYKRKVTTQIANSENMTQHLKYMLTPMRLTNSPQQILTDFQNRKLVSGLRSSGVLAKLVLPHKPFPIGDSFLQYNPKKIAYEPKQPAECAGTNP